MKWSSFGCPLFVIFLLFFQSTSFDCQQSCEGNVSGNTGSDVICIPTMTSYLLHQWRHTVSGNVSYPTLAESAGKINKFKKLTRGGAFLLLFRLATVPWSKVTKPFRSYGKWKRRRSTRSTDLAPTWSTPGLEMVIRRSTGLQTCLAIMSNLESGDVQPIEV